MKQKLPTRRMREQPDLEQLKRQAKELLIGFRAGDASAASEVNSHYHTADASMFALHDAQLVIARSYGFESWPKLKAFVDGVTVKRLIDAVQANDLPQVKSMLAARPELANMAVSYWNEHRPIHYAVMNRLPEMVRLLLQHGADPRSGIHPHRQATTAWTLAKERGFMEIVAIIEEAERRRGQTPEPDEIEARGEIAPDEEARLAVASGDVEWLRRRFEKGGFANHVRWDDGGLLTVAVEHNRPEALALLLEFGFDPDERVSSGEGDWTAYSQGYPLWHCAALGRRQMAETLLRAGANPNVHVDSSGSSVHSAYSHKQWEMVELLRSHGGVVSADTAAIYRQTELVRQMLESDAAGTLPEGIAAPGKPLAEELLRFGSMGGAAEVVRMALERIAWPRDDPRWFGPLTEPVYFWHHIPWLSAGDKELDRRTYLVCFCRILERCDPNIIGSFGRTVLHDVAAMRDHINGQEAAAFAQEALKAGTRMDVRDDILRSTSLGWACRWGRVEVVRTMLERGADPLELDGEPWARPLAWAEKMGHAEIVKILRDRG